MTPADTNPLREAAIDALSGWQYIRRVHGDLYGVGWDRVETALSAALASEPSETDWHKDFQARTKAIASEPVAGTVREALVSLDQIVDLDEHGRYGRLARLAAQHIRAAFIPKRSSDDESGCPRKCGEATDSGGSGNDRNSEDTMQGDRPAAVVKVPSSEHSAAPAPAGREAIAREIVTEWLGMFDPPPQIDFQQSELLQALIGSALPPQAGATTASAPGRSQREADEIRAIKAQAAVPEYSAPTVAVSSTAEFQRRVVKMIGEGCVGFHFSTGPKWHEMSVEDRCAAIMQTWDAPALPRADRGGGS